MSIRVLSKGTLALFVGGTISVFSVAAQAHHSFAMFDRDKTMTIKGTVKDVEWTAPHVWFDVMVPDAKGVPQRWGIEAMSPAIVTRSGWKSDAVKSGDQISVVIHPLKDGKPGGQFMSLTLANGKTLGENGPGAAGAAGRGGGASLPVPE